MPTVIDCDQHLFEPRDLWRDYADPAARGEAIRMEDDALGHTHLVWKGRRMGVAQVQVPGDTEAVGRTLADVRAGRPARAHYDELVPPAYSQPAERLRILDAMGVDEAVLFPNYGLAWEYVLRDDPEATRANMAAWNRFALDVAAQGRGRLHPVAHLTLRDPSPERSWLEGQLAALAAGGVRLAMVGPGLVDGKPLSHPELDRAWASFVHHGISPVFHVANVERPFADAWYTDATAGAEHVEERTDLVLNSVFLWTGVALALADLTINGVLHRHPDLRLGIMELSAPWLPMFLMYLDGGIEFTSKLNGRARFDYAMKPSEYVRRHVRVAGFSYERPDRLARRAGDLFMACSDWPHTEGSAHPLEDYRKLGGDDCTPAAAPGLFGDNLAWLLRRGVPGERG
jgi:hypothetical protein